MQGLGPHSAFARPGQRLLDHLQGVSDLAASLAAAAVPTDPRLHSIARLTGWLHDLGKLRPEFQELLAGLRSRSELTHHSFPGAVIAAKHFRQADAAFCIQGHHTGLPERAALKDQCADPAKIALSQQLFQQLQSVANLAAIPPQAAADPLAFDLQTRLLFSCLVDADWRNSAAASGAPLAPAPALDPSGRLPRVLSYIAARSTACRSNFLRDIRSEILHNSMAAAEGAAGVYTLAVPTGGGKTLATLAFALAHASRNNLRRIIYVAPYLSIIEQNARAWREALALPDDPADPTLLEHHSLAEDTVETESDGAAPQPRSRTLAENWDAPFIITTSVQFYESLFTNRPGRARKLHNIARSIVILDECQTLPFDLLVPTVRMLGQLAASWGTSLLLSTATQPAWKKGSPLADGLTTTDIVPDAPALHRRLARVTAHWPRPTAPDLEPAALADLLLSTPTTLCIVNTRRQARDLFKLCKPRHDFVAHLSTSMCPDHRLRVLDTVRTRLRSGHPTLLISTQLIEAGVDLDFPVVYRELAPLDAIIQAAGRCNREGLLNPAPGVPGGTLHIFSLAGRNLPPDSFYRNATAQLRAALAAGTPPDLIDPAAVARFQHELINAHGLATTDTITQLRHAQDFPQICEKYRLVEDNSLSFCVQNYPFCPDVVASLCSKLPHAAARRRLARFSVNVFQHEAAGLTAQGFTHPHPTDPSVSLFTGPYDTDLGIVPSAAPGPLVV